jgi:hypothetical protein
MRRRCSEVLLAAALAAVLGSPPAAAAAARPAHAGPLAAGVLAPPSPVLATNKRVHLVYEILVQNRSSATLRFRRIEVRDPVRGRRLASFGGRAIRRILAVGPLRPATSLAPGQRGVLFLNVALAPAKPAPARLEHRFVISLGNRRMAVSDARTRVDPRHAVVLGAPLRGGRLLDANGCCGASPHRRALLPIHGRLFLAQRFAIDFVRIGRGSTFRGDPHRNASYFIFKAPVLAAAPGRIVSTRNDLHENRPPLPISPVTLRNVAGNFVIEALGHGRFALYAHLHTGSVRVHAGQRVRRGQILGLVGNTGNSSEPHLHFHVMDGPSALLSNGLPYVFTRFRLQGRVVGLQSGSPSLVPAAPPRVRAKQLPLQGDLVAFPARARR